MEDHPVFVFRDRYHELLRKHIGNLTELADAIQLAIDTSDDPHVQADLQRLHVEVMLDKIEEKRTDRAVLASRPFTLRVVP